MNYATECFLHFIFKMYSLRSVHHLLVKHIAKLITFVALILLLNAWFTLRAVNRKITHLNRIADTLKQQRKRDWHDYQQIQKDGLRQGPGDQGKPFKQIGQLSPDNISLLNFHGFNTAVSDIISVERSVPDIRNEKCRQKRYLSKLPAVSVIIIFNNEHPSTLKRTLHSVVNRTPRELLHEIVLVDDFSHDEDLKELLEYYIEDYFPDNLIKIVRLPERSGLIRARCAGARTATAPVLVFFDSHIETNYNWLPPLLEPIAFNRRTVTLPLIDQIHEKDFQYLAQDNGARGSFDWLFEYKRLPLAAEFLNKPTEPFPTPVMAGGLFAIARDFFWHLGGYDPSLDIWGGEQYELSFKVWMCGGRMLEVPCARVGHIYRGPRLIQSTPRNTDYLRTNLKRVAEVWMDEYKEFLYENDATGEYKFIDTGDLSVQKALRAKLKCKSFKWFLTEIAPDLLSHYPPVWPEPYAHGALQSFANPKLCLDALTGFAGDEVGLKDCAKDLEHPTKEQKWELSSFRDLRLYKQQLCAESFTDDIHSGIQIVDCHQADRLMWYYDRLHFWLRLHENQNLCLEAVPRRYTVRMAECNKDNRQLRWHFAFTNHSALNQYYFKL